MQPASSESAHHFNDLLNYCGCMIIILRFICYLIPGGEIFKQPKQNNLVLRVDVCYTASMKIGVLAINIQGLSSIET